MGKLLRLDDFTLTYSQFRCSNVILIKYPNYNTFTASTGTRTKIGARGGMDMEPKPRLNPTTTALQYHRGNTEGY